MSNSLYQRDIVSMRDLTLNDIQVILDTAQHFKKNPISHVLQNKIIAHCFFESSTRTRLSFETAALRSGGKIIGFSSDEALSMQKGESLSDTVRVISNFADLIVIRNAKEGAARLAAEISDKPVINAGDGANQHPTQALVDLFTMQECQGKLQGLSIGLLGDLKYARTIRSLTQACMIYDMRVYLISPEGLSLPETICDDLKKAGIRFSFHDTLEEVISKIDILYLTRIQKERLGEADYHLLKSKYTLTPHLLRDAKKTLKVLHPLPRLNEIDTSVDSTPYAHYFSQAANGTCVRQAILTLLLNESL